MSGMFSNCGHPFTAENTVKDGGGRVRCKTCRLEYYARTGRLTEKAPKVAKPPAPKRCCSECAKVLHHANTSGLCFSCYNKQMAGGYLAAAKDNGGLSRDTGVAADILIKAIHREHPGIMRQLHALGQMRRAKGLPGPVVVYP